MHLVSFFLFVGIPTGFGDQWAALRFLAMAESLGYTTLELPNSGVGITPTSFCSSTQEVSGGLAATPLSLRPRRFLLCSGERAGN